MGELVFIAVFLLIILATSDFEADFDKITEKEKREKLIQKKDEIREKIYEYFHKEEKELLLFDDNWPNILEKTFLIRKNERDYRNDLIYLYYGIESNHISQLSTTKLKMYKSIELLEIIKTKIHYENNIPNGPFTIFYFSGDVMMIGEFKNGKLHGKLQKYSRVGYLLEEKNYSNDVKTGAYIKYSINRNQIFSCSYVENKLSGEYIHYYQNGNRILQMHYNNEVIDNRFEAYYNNGKVFTNCYFIMGNLDGVYIEYDSDGEESKYYVFNNGKVVKGVNLDENKIYNSGDIFAWIGKKILSEAYSENEDSNYDEEVDGYISEEEKVLRKLIQDETNKYIRNKNDIVKDKIIKKVTYYPNRKIREVYNLKKELFHGEHKIYYNNGQIKESTNYCNGKKNGKISHYYPNGQLQKLYYAVNDVYEGICKFYYSNGKIMGECTFANNYLIKNIKKYSSIGEITEENITEFKVILDKTKIKGSNNRKKYYMEEIELYFEKEIFNEEMQLYILSSKEIGEIYEINKKNHYTIETAINKKFTGIKNSYYPNGNLKYSISFLNGKLNGDILLFYPNGIHYLIASYIDDKVINYPHKIPYITHAKNELYLSYFLNENKESVLIEEIFEKNFLLVAQQENNKLNGQFTVGSSNNISYIEGTFSENYLNGIMFIKDESETILEEIYFNSGKILGRLKAYLVNKNEYENEYIYNYEEPSGKEKYLIWGKSMLHIYLEKYIENGIFREK